MDKKPKDHILNELRRHFDSILKMSKSQSLYKILTNDVRVYFRYSKLHRSRRSAFYGLRAEDLLKLEGHNSYICFLWNDQTEPLFIPYIDFKEIFNSIKPAADGQFKPQIFFQDFNDIALYIPKVGRFSIESYVGWDSFFDSIKDKSKSMIPELSHSQIQTLLGAIGFQKNNDIWIPLNDRSKLDWELTKQFGFRDTLPSLYPIVKQIISEIDVIWVKRGSNEIRSLFEIEHTTPIYSGLLRFNDLLLQESRSNPIFNIVSNEANKSRFMRQIQRPTFQASGLNELCTFLDYSSVYNWFKRTFPILES